MRRAGELALAALLLAALLLAACGAGSSGARLPGVTAQTESEITFRDQGVTTTSAHDDAAAVEAVRVGGGLRITAFQGTQRSGGYAIRIERITRLGDELRVHAAFIAPAKDALVTMALTSPAHTVAVDETAAVVVLYDTSGAERARARPR